MKRIKAVLIAVAGIVPFADAPAQLQPAPAPAASTGWQRQPGCAWRNHWSDGHHSALSIDWNDVDRMMTLTLISGAFESVPDDSSYPIQMVFGSDQAPVVVDAHATTGPGYAILSIPFGPALEHGLMLNGSLAIFGGGQPYLSLDMAGTAEAIAAVKACAASPQDLAEGDLEIE